ncbi:hypothetical protein SJI19_16785 [Acerihabitans sp. TG2]|uniref:hypothetical protein n=1 Tax=Acerihabitans sp. TG2 TaxID=3096008 RepID=UPI002B23164C|nr:hypothetical protein [Acerihabitans sp. TG2]MEA9392182.1 hypothetical protein [Acerihabitans sp. TG2]
MYSNPLSAEGLILNFSSFPFIPSQERIPFDCPNMAWVAVEHLVLDEKGLGRYVTRVKRFIVEDLGDLAYTVADLRNTKRGFIIYKDMKPELLSSNISAIFEKCPVHLRNRIISQCYPEDIMIALQKSLESEMTFEKITEYLSVYRSIMFN